MKVMKGVFGLAVFFGLLFYGIQFAQNNDAALSLKLPGGWETQDVQLWALVLISAGAGAVVAFLIFVVELVAMGVSKRKLSRRIKGLEREISDLRNIPLTTSPARELPKPLESKPDVVGQPEDAPTT
jgi:uncharacterized membrane protein YciS (DUF1049 family)